MSARSTTSFKAALLQPLLPLPFDLLVLGNICPTFLLGSFSNSPWGRFSEVATRCPRTQRLSSFHNGLWKINRKL